MRRTLAFVLLVLVGSLTGCGGKPPETTKESAVIIFRNPDGRTISADELQGISGTFRYEIIGKGKVPAEAESLHEQARRAGGAGDYKKAITLLEQAAKLAPDWPYPVYDMAYTYLLMNDAGNALKHYRRTVELSPRGFFTAITACDTLTREEKGELPAGTYMAYLSLEWMDDAGKKAEAVRKLAKRVPTFAPAWKELAMLTDDDTEKLDVIEKGLAANPDAETKGVLEINRALVLNRKGEHDAAVKLLGGLVLDPSSTYSTEHLAKFTLGNITK